MTETSGTTNTKTRGKALPKPVYMMGDELRLLPMRSLEVKVGISSTVIYNMIAAGDFPSAKKVGGKSLWNSREIDQWILDL